MALVDVFDFPVAYNPDSDELVTSAVFEVFATDDASFANPLTVRDMSGAVISELRSSAAGVLPQFRIDGEPVEVVLKSGDFVTRWASRFGAARAAVDEAGLDSATVQAAIDAGATAAASASAAATSETNAELERQAAVAAQQAAEAAATEAGDHAAAVQAVEATNDGIMSSVLADPEAQFTTDLSAKIGTPVNVRSLGIKGDGTNERTLLQSIIGSGGDFFIPAGCVIDISGGHLTLSTAAPTTIRMEQGSAIRQSTNHRILVQDGSAGVGSPVSITAGAGEGSSQITAAGLGAVVGDWVMVRSEDVAHPDVATKLGYLRQVMSVAGNVFSLDAPIPRTLATSPTVVPVTLAARVTVHGPGRIYHTNPDIHGLQAVEMYFSDQPTFTGGLEIGPLGSSALGIISCVGGQADCYWHDLKDGGNFQAGPVYHYGYGVNVCGASRGFKAKGYATRVRHAFTTGSGGNYGEPEGCVAERDFIAQNTHNTAFDTHEQGVGTVLDGTAINCPVGFSDRAYKTVISGNALGCGAFAGTTSDYGIGVQIVNKSRFPQVLATIQNTDATALAHINVSSGSTGTLIAAFTDQPPTGVLGIKSGAAYTLAGGRVQGTRDGIASRETQIPAGAMPQYLSFNSPAGEGSEVAFRHAGSKRFAFNKQTTGDYFEIRAYDTDGSSVLGSPILLGRVNREVRFGGTLMYRRREFTTSPIAAAVTDHIIAITSASGAITVNLPACSSFGAGELIVLGEATVDHTVTVVPNGANTFADGATSKTLSSHGGSLRIISNGKGAGVWTVL